ncbi:MAG: pirin family protein [Chitinophagia bacterium]|nr:pirin family protein [Chitinophagia bacterium]
MKYTDSNIIYHPANSRGYTEWNWLKSYHSFSFGNYVNPSRMQFGALRVLNDDWVKAGAGFGAHPHANMEIVTIPLSGDLQHRDSTGRDAIIRKHDVQIMSAGTGITHSEMNASNEQPVAFLQIWVLPEKLNISPNYEQRTIDTAIRNHLVTIVAPDNPQAVRIQQQCWMTLLTADPNRQFTYHIHRKESGVYVFIIDGSAIINEQLMGLRDGAGWVDTDLFAIYTKTEAQILLIEVPV